ncbi:hypothetical protein RCH22_000127 [Cryobacterium psychrotolerans]|nr:hypothetical protein [Cryobacterium psychrotolerans]
MTTPDTTSKAATRRLVAPTASALGNLLLGPGSG